MKTKLSVIFAVVAVVCVVVVFKFKQITDYFKSAPEQSTEVAKEITAKDLHSFFKGSKWLDYAGAANEADPRLFDASKVVYVHLWASWCAPCLNEIPELIAFAKKNKNSAFFVLVSLDETQDDLNKFLKSFPEMNDPMFMHVWDNEKKISKFVDADRLPMTIALPPEGNLREIRSVVDWKNL